MFDLNDPFYQDYCSTFKTLAKTDMLLTDRIDHIYNNMDAKCQDNCIFSNYILDTNYINCSCNVYKEKKKEYKTVDELNYNTFMQSFYYVLKYSNYKIFKCYKLVFVKTVFSENKGSIFILVVFILYLVFLIIHFIKGVTPLKNNMLEIFEENGIVIKEINKNNLFFPPQKNKKSSLKGKKRKASVLSIHQKESKQKIKLDKESKILSNSKLQVFKEKKNKDKADIKRFANINETLKPKRKSTIYKRSTKIAFNENKNNYQKIEQKEQKKRKLDDFELNELS